MKRIKGAGKGDLIKNFWSCLRKCSFVRKIIKCWRKITGWIKTKGKRNVGDLTKIWRSRLEIVWQYKNFGRRNQQL